MNRLIKETEFAAIDTETTGFSPACGDRICEIGIVKVKNWKIIDRYEQIVNPRRPIPPQVSIIHTITDDMVKDAPSFPEIAGEIMDMIRGSVLVFHNASFDISFIESELRHAGAGGEMDNIIVDTLKLLRKAFRFPSNSLTSISSQLDIPHRKKHRALDDAMVTVEVLKYIVNKLEIETLGELLQYQ